MQECEAAKERYAELLTETLRLRSELGFCARHASHNETTSTQLSSAAAEAGKVYVAMLTQQSGTKLDGIAKEHAQDATMPGIAGTMHMGEREEGSRHGSKSPGSSRSERKPPMPNIVPEAMVATEHCAEPESAKASEAFLAVHALRSSPDCPDYPLSTRSESALSLLHTRPLSCSSHVSVGTSLSPEPRQMPSTPAPEAPASPAAEALEPPSAPAPPSAHASEREHSPRMRPRVHNHATWDWEEEPRPRSASTGKGYTPSHLGTTPKRCPRKECKCAPDISLARSFEFLSSILAASQVLAHFHLGADDHDRAPHSALTDGGDNHLRTLQGECEILAKTGLSIRSKSTAGHGLHCRCRALRRTCAEGRGAAGAAVATRILRSRRRPSSFFIRCERT